MELTMKQLPVEGLQPYHRNPRKGSVAAVRDSLKAFGQTRTIVVNVGTHTGRPNEVLAGNHTLQAARELGLETLAASVIDVDDETAARIVLADNRTSDLGYYDEELLADLLSSIDDLSGTGYEAEDISDLVAALEETAGELAVTASKAPAAAPTPPSEFPSFDTDLPTDYSCPRCAYSWSGKPKGAPAPDEDEA